MVDETLALSTKSSWQPADAAYDAVYAAVMATIRGRWFLEEYARRSCNADTRLVLKAIERIEGVIRRGQAREAGQAVRIELLEMAKAIAQTRADIAEMGAVADGRAAEAAPKPAAGGATLAAVERLQDMVWAMRERGVDMATCDQIANVAAAIRAAPVCREGNDPRAEKLSEVLTYLEQRIDAMLDAAAATAAAAPQSETPPPAAVAETTAAADDPLADVAAAMAVLMQPGEVTSTEQAAPMPTPQQAPLPAAGLCPQHAPNATAQPLAHAQHLRVEPRVTPGLAAAPSPEPAMAAPPVVAASDARAALNAMSHEERIALFS